MMPALKILFDLMGDDIVQISTEKDSLKNERGSNDEECLKEPKSSSLKQFGSLK